MSHSRRAMTRRDAVAIILLGGVVAAMLLMVVPVWIAERSPFRTVCSANLGAIGMGFARYATANNDWWPTPAHKVPAATQPIGEVTYVRRIGAKRGAQGQPEAGATTDDSTEVSTTRAFWFLIRSGAVSPRSLICPSSGDKPNEDQNPTDYWDFGTGDQVSEGMGKQDPAANWLQVSYGYQVPFGRIGRPNGDVDNDMALAADKGPYGAWLEAGLKGDPGPPTATMPSSPDDWRKWNSPNHGGVADSEGQNAMYPDAHVTFMNAPMGGMKRDNIYTQWSSASPDENGRVQGRPPTETGREVPMGETDSFIYP